MAATFKGDIVTVLRPAIPEDPGFVEGVEHVLIRLTDGTECVVAKTDLKDNEAPAAESAVKEPAVKEPAVKEPVAEKDHGMPWPKTLSKPVASKPVADKKHKTSASRHKGR